MAARTVQKRSCDRDRLQLKAELRKEVGIEQRAVSRAHAHITAYTITLSEAQLTEFRLSIAYNTVAEARQKVEDGESRLHYVRHIPLALRGRSAAREREKIADNVVELREGVESSSLFFLYFIFRLQTRFSHISEHSEFFEFLSYNSHFHFHCQTVWSASAQRWWPRGGGWRCRCNSGGIGSSAARRCPLRGRGRGRFAWESACGAIAGSVTPCLLSAPP